ncbi:uncharacterized protein EAF02_005583 [Botrytis sinoallii]|uniref:uncharacterized protein n=1 Tax=Botrytis sinoallii TaxID=1463999 RepID=UPI001902B7D0|nr:uncharacterized protein EAF02_005583 [Botrytis sinoallii]KAF7883663.1 hypothetical protein EAF02_005583 [Botrytis sinoallii]
MSAPQGQIELSHAFERLLEERLEAERLRRDLIFYWHTLILEQIIVVKRLFQAKKTIVPGTGTPDTLTDVSGLERLPSPLSPVVSARKTNLRAEFGTERISRRLEGLLKKYQGVIGVNFLKGKE